VNASVPIIDVGLGNSTDAVATDNVTFSILFDSIREVNSAGATVVNFQLNIQNFSFSEVKTSSYTEFIYQLTLPNQAVLYINVTSFSNASSFVFANQTTKIAKNGFKYAMQIVRWPFGNIANRLLISVRTAAQSANGNGCQTTDLTKDESGNLLSLQVQLNGVTLYGKFSEYAYLDSLIKVIQFYYNASAGDVVIEIPHFWDYAAFDPDFQVLIDPEEVSISTCQSGSQIPLFIIIVVVGGTVVLGIILVVTVLVYKSHQRKILLSKVNKDKRGTRTSMRPLNSSSSSSSFTAYADGGSLSGD